MKKSSNIKIFLFLGVIVLTVLVCAAALNGCSKNEEEDITSTAEVYSSAQPQTDYSAETSDYYYEPESAATERRTSTTTTRYYYRYTTKKKSSTTDEYNVNSYSNEEDFYDEHYDDFFDYYDAEDYYNEHHE